MQNLAGHKDSTRLAKSELEEAGIPVVVLDEPYGEPKAWVGGLLHGFTFRRAWYYWIVSGPMPLSLAQKMYSDEVGRRDVRVDGHCGCPPPEDFAQWMDAGGKPLMVDSDGSEERKWRMLCERHPSLGSADDCRFVADPSAVEGALAYIDTYHVDSAEGLRLIANTIRSMHKAPALSAA